MNKYRTHHCSELDLKDLGKEVTHWLATPKKRS